jgi:hypothetical protein
MIIGITNERRFMTDLGRLVFDTLGELFHKGETRLDPDSAEGIELRKAALSALCVTGDDGITVSRRELAQTVLEHLMGFVKFDAVKAASRAYEEARIRPTGH